MTTTVDSRLHVPIPQATLRHWADHLLPPFDVWFWDSSALDVDLSSCVLMTRSDYLAHPTFRDILYVNAYFHWRIPPEVAQFIVSGPDWILDLSATEQRRVLEQQVALQRGLVFPRSHFDAVPTSVHPFEVGDQVVICHAAWDASPSAVQDHVLRTEQRVWDETACLPLPDDTPDHIRAIANTFSLHEGANCMATSASCFTGETWMANAWMYQGPFRDLLTRHGYREVDRAIPVADDVVAIEAGGEIMHATYCLREDRFVNKNGQSRFNPIRIVDWATICRDWPESQSVIYQRNEEDVW